MVLPLCLTTIPAPVLLLLCVVRRDPSVAISIVSSDVDHCSMSSFIFSVYSCRLSLGGGPIFMIWGERFSSGIHGGLYRGKSVGVGLALVMRAIRCIGDILASGICILMTELLVRFLILMVLMDVSMRWRTGEIAGRRCMRSDVPCISLVMVREMGGTWAMCCRAGMGVVLNDLQTIR